jgi:DNA-binding transcriptional MerR regulator
MSDKIFYTMGEVAEMFDVNASLIRYWGTQFSCLKPQRNKKGNRLFSKSDIETLKLIYHYVKERGMTLEGAKRALRGDRSQDKTGSANVELMERLQSLRSMLIAVRDSLDEQAEVVANKVAETATAEAESTAVSETPKPAYREQTLFDW